MGKRSLYIAYICLCAVATGRAQQNLHQLLQQANKQATDAKKNSPAQPNNKPSLPPGYDNSWKVTISATRTMTSATNLASKTGACRETVVSSASLTVHVSVSTDQAIGQLNGDDFSLSTLAGSEFASFAKPLKGTYTVTGEISASKVECGGSVKSHFAGSGVMDPTQLDLHFDFNKKRKEGNFQLPPPDGYHFIGSGNIVSKYKDNPTATVDAAELGKAEMGMLYSVCGVFQGWNYPLSENAAIEAGLQRSPITGHMASIGYTKFGYDISYTQSETVKGIIPDGFEGTDETTFNTNVQISITNQDPIQYEAILEPVSLPGTISSANYDQWIPTGPSAATNGRPASSHGNSIAVRVYLVDKNKSDKEDPGPEYDVDCSLTEVTSEPGYCLNYPLQGANTDLDLRFDSALQHATGVSLYQANRVQTSGYTGKDFIIILTSYDYGSFGKLQVNVKVKDTYGDALHAHLKGKTATQISFPKDDNHNQIADYWEAANGVLDKNYVNSWDEEEQPGNSNNGDGLTIYEEYRGIMAKSKFKRLSPTKKDIIVGNMSSTNLDAGISYFMNGTGGSIVPTEVVADKELDTSNAIVNKNSSLSNANKQYGIILIRKAFERDSISIVLGQVFVKNGVPPNLPPGGHIPPEPVARNTQEVDRLAINTETADADFSFVFAHELSHCMNVQHHGNSKSFKFDSFDRYTINDTEIPFQYIDENGSPQDKAVLLYNIENHIDMEAAKPGSQSSGDVSCIMCYNRNYEYSFPETNEHLLIKCDLQLGNGTRFCTSAAGTGRNSADKKPYPVFGPATEGGNCTAQFQVKSYD